MKLNVGCGPVHRKREIGIDRYHTSAVEVQADLFDLPFADESAELIRMDQVLEHLPRKSAVRALLEAKRVLEPGGKLTLGVPDMAAVCRAYPNWDLADRVYIQGHIFGSQTHEGQYHKSGWDKMILIDLLESLGFVGMKARSDSSRPEGYSLRVMARKPA